MLESATSANSKSFFNIKNFLKMALNYIFMIVHLRLIDKNGFFAFKKMKKRWFSEKTHFKLY
jgi:hypothetical protein